jgi:serine/threonine protein kinase
MYLDRLWQLWAGEEEWLGHIQWNVSVKSYRIPSLTRNMTYLYSLDYAGPEILRGERYHGKEQDVWAFGVVAYVLLVGECPFMTASEAQDGLESPFTNSSIALDERCVEGKERDGEEADGGGALEDAAALVRACLQVDVAARPTFEKICQSRFLTGRCGWGSHP